MTTLFAQPYDISATGFYFENHDEYLKRSAALKNEYGDPVEEFEIEYIDGDGFDCELAKAWGLHQGNISAFLDVLDEWDDHQKQVFIIAVGECGYSFDPSSDHLDDFEVDIYELDNLTELAEQFVEDGLYGPIPESLRFYIDYSAIALDLSVEYTETRINGVNLIYTCR